MLGHSGQMREFSLAWRHFRSQRPRGPVSSFCPDTSIPWAYPRVRPDSQVEDQVVVSLLGDAVVEPDCGRGEAAGYT